MSSEFWFWAFVIAGLSQPFVLFCGKIWLKSYLEKGVEHRFGVKLEELRSELRNNEEEIKGEIRRREADLSVLRERVFNARAGRQTLIDKRRIEALEKVWEAVTSLNAFRIHVTMMTIINFETASREASRNPRFRDFLEMISGGEHMKTEKMRFASSEQLFIGETSWSYYNAYFTVIALANMQVIALKSGLADSAKMFKIEGVIDAMKKALPEYENYINEHGLTACYNLCEEVNSRILRALREELNGKEVELEDVSRVTNLNWELKKVEMQRNLAASGFEHVGQIQS